jgi:hypothetical protein
MGLRSAIQPTPVERQVRLCSKQDTSTSSSVRSSRTLATTERWDGDLQGPAHRLELHVQRADIRHRCYPIEETWKKDELQAHDATYISGSLYWFCGQADRELTSLSDSRLPDSKTGLGPEDVGYMCSVPGRESIEVEEARVGEVDMVLARREMDVGRRPGELECLSPPTPHSSSLCLTMFTGLVRPSPIPTHDPS